MSRFITDAMAEEAMHWLMDNAAFVGEARKRAILTERFVRRVVAIEKKKSEAKTAAGKEEDAHASEAYLAAITDEAVAAGEWETAKAQRESRGALLDAWRTIRASERALSK